MSKLNPIHSLLMELWVKPSSDWSLDHCEKTLFALLDEGMDPNIVFHDFGMYPLFYVSNVGMTIPMVKKLIDVGADVNFRSHIGSAPLHRLDSRSLDKADLLFKAGMDIHSLNHLGESALHIAMRDGDSRWIEWLIQHGADLMCVNPKGQTPLDVAGQTQRISTPEQNFLLDNASRNAGASSHHASQNAGAFSHHASRNADALTKEQIIRNFALQVYHEHFGRNISKTCQSSSSPKL